MKLISQPILTLWLGHANVEFQYQMVSLVSSQSFGIDVAVNTYKHLDEMHRPEYENRIHHSTTVDMRTIQRKMGIE